MGDVGHNGHCDTFTLDHGHTFHDWTHAETGANTLKAAH